MLRNKENIILGNIIVFAFAFLFPLVSMIKLDNYSGNFRMNSTEIYINKVNELCPEELTNNLATKEELYININNPFIKNSIEQKMFTHCGAYCLFDYRNPTHGWYWNNDKKQWEYTENIFHLCPDNEISYATNKFLRAKRVI